MEILFDSIPVLEALYDLQITSNNVMEQAVIVSHNFDKTGDCDILTEGVSDILSLIVNGIKAFINKIKEIVNKCIMKLNSFGMEYDKLIQKYGSSVIDKDFKPFDIEGFNFVTLTVNKPDDSCVYKIIDDFNNDIIKFNRYSSQDIRTICMDAVSPSKFNKIRGEILGNKMSIPDTDFKKYVYTYYRNGIGEPYTISVDPQYVKAAINHSDELLSAKKTAKAEKDALLGILGRMEKFFSVKASSLYDDVQKTYNISSLQKSGYSETDARKISESKLTDLTNYMMMRYQQVVTISNIVSIIYIERISALTDQINQESQAVRMAIRRLGLVMESETLVGEALEEANTYPPTPNENWVQILEGVSMYKGGDKVWTM